MLVGALLVLGYGHTGGAGRENAAGAVVVADGPGEQMSPAIAGGDEGFLVAWESCQECPTRGADLALRALGPDGRPRGPVVPLAATVADERSPSLAYNPHAQEFLAVWSLRYPGVADRYAVRARRVGPDGRLRGEEKTVAEVEGVWPAAVVSSRGGWLGYDVAWAQPGPRQDLTATIIAARHLAADGEPSPEVWQLSEADFEALRPLAARASPSAGTLVGWFAYRAGEPADRPRLRGIRLGASGRPTGAALDLVPEAVCAAALADEAARSDLLLATIGCEEVAGQPGGQLEIRRLNRSGISLGQPWQLGEVPAAGLTLAAAQSNRFAVTYAAGDEGALAVQWLDGRGRPLGAVGQLAGLEAPAAAGGSGAVVVVAARRNQADYDVVGYRLTVPTATATSTLPPASPPPSLPSPRATVSPTGAARPSPTPTTPPAQQAYLPLLIR